MDLRSTSSSAAMQSANGLPGLGAPSSSGMPSAASEATICAIASRRIEPRAGRAPPTSIDSPRMRDRIAAALTFGVGNPTKRPRSNSEMRSATTKSIRRCVVARMIFSSRAASIADSNAVCCAAAHTGKRCGSALSNAEAGLPANSRASGGRARGRISTAAMTSAASDMVTSILLRATRLMRTAPSSSRARNAGGRSDRDVALRYDLALGGWAATSWQGPLLRRGRHPCRCVRSPKAGSNRQSSPMMRFRCHQAQCCGIELASAGSISVQHAVGGCSCARRRPTSWPKARPSC
ncbi:hypothetical protein ABIF15_005823 [Bradyrhizobium elkanii]